MGRKTLTGKLQRIVLTALVAGSMLAPPAGAEPAKQVAQEWVADQTKSTLGFTATQQGAEFSGRFREFSAGLKLQQTDTDITITEVGATIRLTSVDTQNSERDDYLAQDDWFDTGKWPEAVFQSKTVRQLGDNRFMADGELTLRGVSRNVQVELVLNIGGNRERGKLRGTAVINRLDFGVGQGDWASTEWVGDAVKVEFDLFILPA